VVHLAFSQITHYGAAEPAIREKLHETIERVIARIPSERQQPVIKQRARLAEAAMA
jgi:uncharacterized membrane protein